MFHRLRIWTSKLGGLFSRRRLDRDFAQELNAHLSLLVEENIRRGMTPEEARRAARVRLGGVTQLRETHRELNGVPVIETLVQDVRYAVRVLAKNPSFTVVAALVLALGICASVAIFAFVDSALLKPLPYPNPNRLVAVTEGTPTIPRANLSYPDYLDWKKLNPVFSSLDVWISTGYLLNAGGTVQPVHAARVSDGFFRTLGVTPLLGRDFYPGEDLPSGPYSVILSYTAWQNWFGGRRDAVGQTVTLSGIPYMVIGVLPKTFQFAPRGDAGLWTALHPSDSCNLKRGCHDLNGVARLKDGVSVQAALAGMTAITRALEKQYPDSNRGQMAVVVPLSEIIVGDVRPILLVLLAGAGLLLLIACVNVTSLLLVRSESRKREIAVRRALGASTARLVRQFVAEGLVLVALSGAIGLASAEWLMQALARLIPAEMAAYVPFFQTAGLNLRVAAFAGGIGLLAALLFAVTPTARLSLKEIRDGLTEGGRTAAGTFWRRFGSNLVVAELAIAMVLLVGAGLLGKSLYRLLHEDVGFQSQHLATMEVAAPPASYGKDAQSIALGREIVSRLSSLPGVQSVAITTRQLPVSFNGNTDWIRFVGKPYNGQHNEVNERDVSSDYFSTLQARLLRGRYFTDSEDESKPKVAIINQALAKKYFPGEDPIGKKFGGITLSADSLKEIIGVVDDIREGALDSDIWPTEYLPFNQSPDSYIGVLVRTPQAPESLLPAMHAVIHQLDPNLGIIGELTLAQRIEDSPTAYLHRSSAWLVGGFALLALLLGVVGLYGVIAYSVSQRTREIGVRVALGAQRGNVYRLVLGEAAWLAVAGVGLGLVCAVAAGKLMGSLLFGTTAWDAPTLAGMVGVLTASALLATYIPARRAVKVDPVVALRCE